MALKKMNIYKMRKETREGLRKGEKRKQEEEE